MSDCFAGQMYVANLQSVEEVMSVLQVFFFSFLNHRPPFLMLTHWLSFQQLKAFSTEQLEKCSQMMKALPEISIGVKKLLMLIEVAKQAEGRELETFFNTFQAANGK